MNINFLQVGGTAATSVQSGAVLTLLELPAALPQSPQLLRATVQSVSNGQATLDIPGTGTVRVAALPGMQAGQALTIQYRPTTQGPSLQLTTPLPTPRAATGPTLTPLDPIAAPPRSAESVRAIVQSVSNGQATLDLPGTGPVRVAALPGMQAGQTLSIQYRATPQGPTLQLTAPLPASPTGPTITLLDPISTPGRGETIQAKILSVSNGQATIDISGTGTVRVAALPGMQVGQALSMQVRPSPQGPTLQLSEPLPAKPPGPTLTPLDPAPTLPRGNEPVKGTVLSLSANQAVIDLPGTGLLRVAALPGMQVGQTLSIQVRPTPEGTVLQLANPLPAVSTPPAGETITLVSTAIPRTGVPLVPSAPQPSVTLQTGQLVTARVLEQPAPDRILVKIGQVVIEARTEQPLPPTGESVTLQVRQVRPEVVLALPREAPAAPVVSAAAERISANVLARLPGGPAAGVELLGRVLRERLAGPTAGEAIAAVFEQARQPDAPPGITRLASQLRALLPEGEPPTAEQIQRFVREGGLQFESRLAAHVAENEPRAATQSASQDVKALVLRALGEASSPALQRHLDSIERQQSANLLAQARGDPILVQVPLLNAGAVSTMHLGIQTDDRPHSGEEGQRPSYGLLMHLELESLGSVRIDARFDDVGASVVFYVASDSARERLVAELASLRQTLTGNGESAVISVRRATELPADRQSAFEALLSGLPRSGSGLDVRA